MTTEVLLQAQPRDQRGKGASRRLRRSGKVPAVVYGANRPVSTIAIDANEVKKRLAHEGFYSSIITLEVAGEKESCILKALQRDPVRGFTVHMDFQRVLADEPIRVNVPLHFTGEAQCPGVKIHHGVVSHLITEVEISCLPRHLPEYLELDVSHLDIDESMHMSEIPLPEGVSIPALQHGEEYDQAVVVIHRPRLEEAEEEEEAPAEGEVVPATEQGGKEPSGEAE